MDDRELLREYVGHHSERAFGELVARHLPFVLGTALRVVREPQAAADVAQNVFIQLARKAWTIRDGQVLSGWLYRATHHTALNALRTEQRRRERETQTMKLAETQTAPEPAWEELAPLMDEALQQLKRGEQDALLLRFFEDKSYREVGQILGLDEKTAGQRVNRALEKMRGYFSRRGVTTTATLLGTALTSHAAAPMPAGLAANVTGASLAGMGGGGAVSGSLIKTYFMTITTKSLIAAAVVIVVGSASLLVDHSRIERQRSADVAAATRAQNGAGSAVAANNSPSPITSDREQAWEQLRAMLENPHQPGTVDVQLISRIVSQLLKTDPDGVPFLLEKTAGLPPGTSRDAAMENLFRLLGLINPVKAFSLVGLISNSQSRDRMTSIILYDMAKGDPHQALAELLKLPDNPQTQPAYRDVFSAWAGANSTTGAAAATAAVNLPAGAARTQALTGVIEGWIGHKVNPDLKVTQAALDWASSLPPADMNVVLNDAMYPTSKQDPALAAQYVGKLSDASVRNAAIQAIARTWAVPTFPNEIQHQDPAAVLDWLDRVATGDTYDTNVEYIFSKLDPAIAAGLMGKVTEPGVRETVITTVATAWGKTNPQAAVAWLRTLPDSDSATRDALVQKLSQPVSGNARP